MGIRHSSYTGAVGITGRESDSSSPDCFMIEPVPEGLEHVVYPKYEEAFRLGLEAFSNPMRVNKFKRPLPYILGSTEFQQQPNAGIVPASKPSCSSGITTPRKSPYNHPSSAEQANDNVDNYLSTAAGMIVYEEEDITSPEDDEAIITDGIYRKTVESMPHSFEENEITAFKKNQTAFAPTTLGHEMETEEDKSQASQTKLDASLSISQLDGGLFDSDNALSDALEYYRRIEDSSRATPLISEDAQTLLPDASIVSIRHQQSTTRSPGERSQVSIDLQQLGKSLSDLQLHRAAGNKFPSRSFNEPCS